MREVEQVLVQPHVAGLHVKLLARGHPAGIVDPAGVRRRLRRRAGAHPDPHQRPVLLDREGARARPRRHHGLRGHAAAHAVAAEACAVVTADQRVAFQRAQRQRHRAVGAAVFERGDAAVGTAQKHDRDAEQPARQRRASHLVGEGSDVPLVAHERGALVGQLGLQSQRGVAHAVGVVHGRPRCLEGEHPAPRSGPRLSPGWRTMPRR